MGVTAAVQREEFPTPSKEKMVEDDYSDDNEGGFVGSQNNNANVFERSSSAKGTQLNVATIAKDNNVELPNTMDAGPGVSAENVISKACSPGDSGQCDSDVNLRSTFALMQNVLLKKGLIDAPVDMAEM